MSKYSEYIKSVKEKDIEFFFGKIERKTNQYFRFTRVKDDDNIVLITNNVRFVKGNPVLLVDDNKAVYLKDWAVKAVKNYYHGINAYAVKISRKYFKVYTFKNSFNDFAFEKENSFDDLLEIAKEQDKENMEIALGNF